MLRVLRRALGVAIGATLIAAGGNVIARSDEPASKPPPPASSEQQPDQMVAEPVVPVGADVPAGTSCGGTWFDNPAMHYGLCLHPGWGFTDFTTAAPLPALPQRQLPALRILSPSAFPWEPGDAPFDAVRDRGMIDVELNLLEPELDDGCSTPVPLRLDLAGCEQRLDDLGQPSPRGSLLVTRIVIPLRRSPEGLSGEQLDGSRLLVLARTSSASLAEEVEQLWRLVASITAF